MERIKLADTRVIVLFTLMDYVPTIMRDAFEVGLLEAGYAWLIVDIHEQFVSFLNKIDNCLFFVRLVSSIDSIIDSGFHFKPWETRPIERSLQEGSSPWVPTLPTRHVGLETANVRWQSYGGVQEAVVKQRHSHPAHLLPLQRLRAALLLCSARDAAGQRTFQTG